MNIKIVITTIMMLFWVLSGSAHAGNYLDAVKVSTDNYKLLSTNENIRVIEMTLKAGKMDTKHSHHSETVYFIRGGHVKIHLSNGKSMEANIPDGHVMHHGAWTHQVENIGTTNIKAIIFEQMP